MDFVIFALSLAIVLASAELFTNGVEWLGKNWRLSEGAVGSLLAAVGTALPETMIPVIAILLRPGEAAEEIGEGAILGAPFMLSTLALFVTGLTAVLTPYCGRFRDRMLITPQVIERDLAFFLASYVLALGAAFLGPGWARQAVAALLVAGYGVYACQTVRSGKSLEAEDPAPLYLGRARSRPHTALVLLQVALALGGIVGGARLFVSAVERLSLRLGVPAFVLSLIIAPAATELPEKFNSVIWVRKGKDTLALGNITGAMVFQSSLLPALGILLTPWRLKGLGLLSAGLALASAAAALGALRITRRLSPAQLLLGGLLYGLFVAHIFAEARAAPWAYALLALYLPLHLWALRRRGRPSRHPAEGGGGPGGGPARQ
ncbi:MAG: sodium:calcium antiporter [Acetobacteraceae bacterium]|nr:sodium:calcium antiporter [Acetobacteraceae bacterium]